MPLAPQLQVAVSIDAFTAMSELPKAQQNKIGAFIKKFRQTPQSPGQNYERIRDARDANLFSVRIDQAYRGIVFKPEAGNVYVLLWVALHDDAYDWARRKQVSINPERGSLQIVDCDVLSQPRFRNMPRDDKDSLFAGYRDRELVRVGVPDVLLPLVRSFTSVDELEAAQSYLPQEAYESLFWLAAGDSLQDVVHRVEHQQEVDTNDFAAALEHPDSKRRFYVAAEARELEALLNSPLERWRVFLHPAQQQIVTNRTANGPIRVLGGAGTGKTVVAMHRAKFLAEEVFTAPTDRILFTTFTKNLAHDIYQNLKKICRAEALERIEVVNFHRWVDEYLRSQGQSIRLATHAAKKEGWEQAVNAAPADLKFDTLFYQSE